MVHFSFCRRCFLFFSLNIVFQKLFELNDMVNQPISSGFAIVAKAGENNTPVLKRSIYSLCNSSNRNGAFSCDIYLAWRFLVYLF